MNDMTEGWCQSGKHYWLDPISRERCCNGYRRVLVVGEPGDDRDGMVKVAGTPCAWVWEPTELEEAE